jgi:hypothetical protein
MLSPEVSRFVRVVLAAGKQAVDLSGDDTEAVAARLEAWWATERRIRAAAVQARSVADLPQWLLDLAAQLGIEE